MSDQEKTAEELALEQEQAQALAAQELEELKTKAAALNLSYHPSISAAKLREKITAYLALQNNPAATPAAPSDDAAVGEGADADAPAQVTDGAVEAAVQTNSKGEEETVFAPVENEVQKRRRIRNEQLKLVRIRVQCMNPNKKEWPGEIFTVGNTAVGTIKKFVPFNTGSDDVEGYHVPQMILTMMQQRECQVFFTKKSKNGVKVRQGRMIKEFAIEVLPDLSEQELRELARRQAVAAGQD